MEILGTPVSRLGFDGILREIEDGVKTSRGGAVYFGNAHNLVEAKRSPEIGKAFREARFVVADGLPVVWASKLTGSAIASRVCGPDVMEAVLRAHPAWTHGFVGGPPGQADLVAKKFSVRSVITSPPFRPFRADHALEDWKEFLGLCPGGRAPEIVWVGLGAPKQERWIHAVAPLAPGTWFLGVGAAFDFLSGTKKRAPLWMQNAGLEWLFRLASEPRRLWKRYVTTNALFLFYVAGSLFQRGRC